MQIDDPIINPLVSVQLGINEDGELFSLVTARGETGELSHWVIEKRESLEGVFLALSYGLQCFVRVQQGESFESVQAEIDSRYDITTTPDDPSGLGEDSD